MTSSEHRTVYSTWSSW